MPGYAADGDTDAFRTASDILGTAIGETLGYLLTAVWTALVVVALGRQFAGRWFAALGLVSAALVFVGVFSPLELPVVDTANFFGYVLWSLWLIAFGVVILVRERRVARRGGDVMSRRWIALGVLCASLLAIVVDNTIVNVALPTLVRELDADAQRAAVGGRRLHARVRRAAAAGRRARRPLRAPAHAAGRPGRVRRVVRGRRVRRQRRSS